MAELVVKGRVYPVPDGLGEAQLRSLHDQIAENPPELTTGQKWQMTLENVAPQAGAVVGGLAGGALGAPVGGVGAIPGAAAGAGLGAAAGTMLPSLTRPLLDPQATPEGTAASIYNAVTNGLVAGATEAVVPKALGAAGEFVRSRVAPTVSRGVQAARDVFARGGKDLTLGEMSPGVSTMWDTVENIASNAFGGSRKAAEYLQGRNADVKGMANDIVGSLGRAFNDEQVADLFVSSLTNQGRALRGVRKMLYEPVDKAAQGVSVGTKAIVDWFRSMSLKDAQGKSVGLKDVAKEIEKQAFDSDWKKAITTTVKGVGRAAATSFQNAAEIRSRLLALGRTDPMRHPEMAPAIRTARFLAAKFDEAEAASALPPAARQALDRARGFTRDVEERLGNEVVRGLATSMKPGWTAGKLLRDGAGPILDKARDVLGPSYDTVMKPRLAAALVGRSLKPTAQLGPQTEALPAGELVPSKFLATLKSVGQRTIEAAAGAPVWRELNRLGNALQLGNQPEKGPGRVAIQLMQTGAGVRFLKSAATLVPGALVGGVSAATGGLGPETAAATGALLLGPSLMARVLFDPRFTKMIADGITQGPRSAAFRHMMTALTVKGNQLVGEQARADPEAPPPAAAVGAARGRPAAMAR